MIYLVANGCQRFGAMGRALPEITKQMLTSQLRELEADGILSRKVFAEVPPRVEYALTPYGQTLLPVIEQMREWGRRHLERSQEPAQG